MDGARRGRAVGSGQRHRAVGEVRFAGAGRLARDRVADPDARALQFARVLAGHGREGDGIAVFARQGDGGRCTSGQEARLLGQKPDRLLLGEVVREREEDLVEYGEGQGTVGIRTAGGQGGCGLRGADRLLRGRHLLLGHGCAIHTRCSGGLGSAGRAGGTTQLF
jgi:hypothetical protein